MKPLTMAGAVFLLLLAGTRVEAQGVASSFGQLSVLVAPGDKITVVDVSGTQAEGRLGNLTGDALTLVTKAGPRQLTEADVMEIRKRRADSLKNGAIIGAVAATAYIVTMLAIFGGSDGDVVNTGRAIAGGVVAAGVGAAAGAGIDALITRRQVIYRKAAGKNSVSISPVFGHGRRGAAITVRF